MLRGPTTHLPALVLAALFLTFGACTGGDEGTVDDGGGRDLPGADDGGASGSDDAGLADDVDGSGDRDGVDDLGGDRTDIDGERLPFSEPCTENEQCEGRVCLRITAGLDEGFCSGFCIDVDDCPPNEWDCVFVANSSTDAAFICLPNDLCIDGDGDNFGIGPGCDGPDCDDDRADVFLGADEICDGIDNDCDGSIDDNPLDVNVDCNTGFPGVCSAGRALCVGGLVDCISNRPATAEICDALDNDCNGIADDNPDGGPLQEACYGASPETLGVGQCASGVRACVDGVTTACVGQTLPFPEICDGLDNDCDGRADEGSPGEGVVCDTGLEGVCGGGTTVCVDGDIDCAQRLEPSEEVCDGLDNDCDGVTDEDDEGLDLTRDCYTGDPETLDVGVCRGGTETCVDGEYGRCEDEVIPSIELCTASDEDCDGVVNNGNPASGFLCDTGDIGLCAFGRTECGEGGAPGTACIPDFLPDDEICDGFDNDCDGEIDEDEASAPLMRACYDGAPETADVGLCTSGVQTCAFGDWGGCVGQQLPGFEICDGADNDCDGGADDGDPGGGMPCTTGEFGICNAGETMCSELGELICNPFRAAEDEVCDGLDNDCNGDTDEGETWSSLGAGCLIGIGICRNAGVFVCDEDDPEGDPVCSAEPGSPEDEICDGLDNDCDGAVDEESTWGDLGSVCAVGLGVCQRFGVQVCDADDRIGPPICSVSPGDPGEEICDGLDNDCDGEIDEDGIWTELGSVCTNGDGICERAGIFVCDADDRSGPPVCNAVVGPPTVETCDGLDNDCDGATDEGVMWTELGVGCTSGLGECTAAGVLVCDPEDSAGTPVCSAVVGTPTVEICDGIDNDCDGAVDEDLAWEQVGQVCTNGIGVCERAGIFVCDPFDRAGAPICNADPGATSAEVCDGLDNDCDGAVDENVIWSEVGTGCVSSRGECAAAGVLICNPAAPAGALICSGDAGDPVAEVCDGRDNDCDGAVDEDAVWADLGGVCTNGDGICERAGIFVCDADDLAGPPVCNAELGPPSTEVCDGLDNDCDGATDEDATWDDLGVGCTSGLGECTAAGVLVCNPDDRAGAPVCSAVDGLPTAEICDGLDNDCDGAVDEDLTWVRLGEVCTDGDGVCERAGVLVCDPLDRSGAPICNAVPGASSPEVCDGLDNDCDGTVDEDAAWSDLGAGCISSRGECAAAGVLVCDPDDPSGALVCSGDAGDPVAEVCDGLDNDCDGAVDEDAVWASVGTACTNGEGVCVRAGVFACDATDPAGAPVCGATPGTPTTEVCDGLDNDCDGSTDEGGTWSNLGLGCTSGGGECMAAGVFVCDPDNRGGPTICSGEPGEEGVEVCDSLDNDCDGSVDEDPIWDTIGTVCVVGEGVCQRAGVLVCNADSPAGPPVCNATPGATSTEICDGLDNDCDGSTDEDTIWDTVGQGCTAGDGICRAAGVLVCDPDDRSGVPVCSAVPGASETEVCDGVDNDCDGSIDEDAIWADLGGVCTAGDGICEAAGILICNPADLGGAPVCNATIGTAETEVCDGLDNDCDGSVDENPIWDDLGVGCTRGDGICRAAGVQVCNPDDRGGATVCSATPGASSTEVCDGLDNDCDGSTDENPIWSTLGNVCTNGDGVCERAGVLACNPDDTAGAPICNAVPGASGTEVCDGLDNDCDGSTDEGATWANLGVGCTSGQGQCIAAGVLVCDTDDTAGAPICSATPGDPVAEVCDGLDNDCDGSTDETFGGLGDTCFEGLGICRSAGVVVCDGPSATECDAVVPDPASPDELSCDYLDDDCDGSIDEDFITDGLYRSVEHCGGCGVACADLWDGGPAAFHVVPVCSVFLLVASCDYTCETGWHDLDLDPANGCEFTPDDGAVYVATAANGGTDSGSCGAWDAPCRTIGYAITRADPTTRPRVRVSDGLYRENVLLSNGISVLGGHNSVNWLRNPSVNVSAITGLNTAVDNATLTAIGITATTELSGFTITAAPGRTGGGNSSGVYVRDANGSLTIRDNVIFAASGGDGTSGLVGSSGANGSGGSSGNSSEIRSPCTGSIDGGVAGTNSCTNPSGGGSTTTDGGTGGVSTCPSFGVQTGSGGAGSGPSPGGGGAGAFSMLGSGSSCYVSGSVDPTPGLPGNPGTDGGGGSGSTDAAGAVSSGRWSGSGGTGGSVGGQGSGGGGGGAAAGVETTGDDYFGATGGGGGSGGCAAGGGTSGSAGGASFAIFVAFSSTPGSSGAMPTILDNTLTRGQGGRGGSGGNGGAGGEPGAGAAGGTGVGGGTYGFCMLDGAVGAEGGRGGHGGGGGGASGGISFDVYVWNAGGNDPGYASNTFSLTGGTDTGGTGGSGGTSNNTDNEGSAGASGLFGTLGFGP